MIITVTGTGTGVGKTVTTAAVTACLDALKLKVVPVKPVQTGEPEGQGDLTDIEALTGVTGVGFARAPEPLAPVAAAQRAGMHLPGLTETAERIRALDGPETVVLVEGAGGLLVELGGQNGDYWTLADLARTLAAPVLVATTTGLGSLNHVALTLEALAHRDLDCLGVIGGIGPGEGWDPESDPATATTLEALARLPEQTPWLGRLPAGAGGLDRAAFSELAARCIDTATLARRLRAAGVRLD